MSKIIALSEASSIALHAMILIARSEKSLNVIQIAEKIDSSKHHIAKVLQRLVKCDFITSQRGPTGGFMLKKKPEEITLLDIYEGIEGRFDVAECPLEKKVCAFDKCIYGNVANKMTNDFRNYLAGQRLKDYL